jgi:hypothetical protein
LDIALHPQALLYCECELLSGLLLRLILAKPASQDTFVHANDDIHLEVTIVLEDLLEQAGFGTVGFPWPDRLVHGEDKDITFDERVIESLAFGDEDVSLTVTIHHEAKVFKTLQLAFIKSKLFIGSDNTPHTPMVALMDSTLKVCFS